MPTLECTRANSPRPFPRQWLYWLHPLHGLPGELCQVDSYQSGSPGEGKRGVEVMGEQPQNFTGASQEPELASLCFLWGLLAWNDAPLFQVIAYRIAVQDGGGSRSPQASVPKFCGRAFSEPHPPHSPRSPGKALCCYRDPGGWSSSLFYRQETETLLRD